MILAIDPGSAKTGTAVVREDAELIHKEIVPTNDLVPFCQTVFQQYPITQIVSGNGTRSKEIGHILARLAQEHEIGYTTVDESYTTEMGKIRYWRYTPQQGWRKLIPTSWQMPPEPVDDFVAWIIAEIYLGNDMPEQLAHARRRKQ
ncbi:MAG: hypothetical protein E6119_05320 [Negativicoccus succinicivorans]|uniref:hypothetical protein n=1 Tax=Negativicoccus succinicivorans TaxID=620903 RepID=UPI0029099E66|nr:hypothetical protein [Negativicoccus succinicivorans]MDU5371899.1 hypothetical protein [Negativicoccus succinicivorans]MDU5399688.1 hypothetical protein [Negativicoccus succinicivorans]